MRRKTYWHLQNERRMPDEYELVSSRLHHHTTKGFELRVPVDGWYRRHQEGSPLVCADWERCRDPRQTTYARYTSLQKTKEAFVDRLFDIIDETGYDQGLPRPWVETLSRVLAPLRYPLHGLQMTASYIGQMAPSG